MANNPNGDGPRPDRRKRARQRLSEAPTNTSEWTAADLQSLVADLELHQEELRIQNEELQASQAAASEARDRYRDLFERAPVGYLVLDSTGRIREANLPAGALLGAERADLEGADLANFIAPQCQDAWFRFRRSFTPDMGRRAEELALAAWAGQASRSVRLEVVPEAGTEVADPRFRCALSDITERVASERFSHTLLDSLGEGVFGIDAQGRFTFINPTALHLLGYPREDDLLGENSHALTHHTDAEGDPYPESECPIYQVMATGEPLEAWQDRFWRANGTSFPVEVYASPLRDSGAPVTGAVVIFTDISGRKEREDTLLKYRSAFEQSRDAVMFLNRDHYLDANPAALTLLRVPSLQAFRNYHPADLSPAYQPDGRPSRDAAEARIAEAFAHGQAFFEWHHQTVDGDTFPAEILISRIDHPDGAILEVVVRDITEEKRAFEAIRQARNRAQKYFEVAGAMMLVLDPEGRVTAINQRGCELLGLPHEAIVGTNWFERFLPADIRGEVREVFQQLMQGNEGESATGENAVLTAAGQRHILAFHNTVLRDSEDRIEGVLTSGMDVTHQRELEARLRYQARHDPLTGLLNRGALEEELDREVARAQRYGGPFALAMFDLDHSKAVNDHYGHATGDRVLEGVVRCARDELRAADLLGRWGGEEFVAILPDTDAEAATTVAERIRQAVADTRFDEAGRVTVSLGVTAFAAGESRSALLKRLDNALYRAKETGRDRVVTAPG